MTRDARSVGVRVVVVHHNQPERCVDTVRALLAQRLPAAVTLEVTVVDNGSRPEARRAIASLDMVEVIDAGHNRGFGGGANVGLREWLAEESGEWALVVPHDAQPATDCLARMLDAIPTAEDAGARVGLVSAEYGDDELPVIDPYFGALTVPSMRGSGWCPTDFAHGTFLLVRRGCAESIGLFDERYFAYCEEADLALRARAAGWQVGIVWGAVVDNPHQGSSPPLVDYLMVRNTIVLVRRHFGLYRATIRFVIAAVTTPWLAVRKRHRSPWFDARARWLALRDVACGRLGPPPRSLCVS